MMTTRYCHKCAAEVQDHGGYCLLGHSLRLASAVEPLGDLKAEVDAVFEEARTEVASALATAESVTEAATSAPVHVPAESHTSTAEETQTGVVATMAREWAYPEPEPVESVEPPSPVVVTRPNVWKALEQEEANDTHDPIAAFAPPPSMDWGPQKGKLRMRKSLKRMRAQEAPGT